jgi:hypothetical protein
MRQISYLLFSIIFIGLVSCSGDENMQGPSFTMDSSLVVFTGYSSSKIINVDATREWTAQPNVGWIKVTPDQYPGNGQHFKARVSIIVDNNITDEIRTGNVDFYINDNVAATLIVNQDKQNAEDTPIETSPITWANLQWAASTAITQGTQFEAGTCVFENGLTNSMESKTGEGIFVQIGWSKNNSSPTSADWSWADCWFNGDWGDNFYYQGKTNIIDEPGVYYYTFRCQQDDGPWVYSGTDGLWDGVNHQLGKFEVLAKSNDNTNYSKLVIDWANLQWNAGATIANGSQFEAGSCVHIIDFTNAETPATEGNKHIICEIGYGTSSDSKDSSWKWTDCLWNGDWGANWYYQGKTPTISISGNYKYAFRYHIIDGEYTSNYFYTEIGDFKVE